MAPAEIERLKELVLKVAGEGLYAISLDESLKLERLLKQRIGELEFGYPIYGEE